MKKLALTVLVLLVVFGSSGCSLLMGKDGELYGAFDWPGYTLQVINWEYSGFPNFADYDVFYKFSPGSYHFAYRIWDEESTYWPYPDGTYEYVGYTVKANEGSLFSDGEDAYFGIYLGLFGDSFFNLSVKGMGEPVVEMDGTRVYSNGAYTITLTTHKLETLPEDASITTFTK